MPTTASSCDDVRILFRAGAGPRRGYGHLGRCRSLAHALGVRPLVALRGGPRVLETAIALGCDVVRGTASDLLRRLAPDVLVVDDPITADARRWMRAARRAGCLVVSIHDLGMESAPLDERHDDRDPYAVLVAHGGGPLAELASDIAEAIVASNPLARIRIAGGFASVPRQEAAQTMWIGAPRGVTRGCVSARAVAAECVERLTDRAMRRRLAPAVGVWAS